MSRVGFVSHSRARRTWSPYEHVRRQKQGMELVVAQRSTDSTPGQDRRHQWVYGLEGGHGGRHGTRAEVDLVQLDLPREEGPTAEATRLTDIGDRRSVSGLSLYLVWKPADAKGYALIQYSY